MNCPECGAKPTPSILPWRGTSDFPGVCAGTCKRTGLCSSCSGFPVIVEHPAAATADTSSSTFTTIETCFPCFKASTNIDWSRTEDVIGREHGHPVILLHGGGACRKMFTSLANTLAMQPGTGFRCVLPDLPGHGTRLKDPLTLDTACSLVEKIAKQYFPTAYSPSATPKPIVIGASLGGYIAMEVAGRNPTLFSAAIIVVAGQTVGVGAGPAAWLALQLARRIMAPLVSPVRMTSLLLSQVPFAEMEMDLIRSESLIPGMYFQRNVAQISLLQSTNSIEGIKQFTEGPVLFINGEKDHRDMEMHLLNEAKRNYEVLQRRAEVKEGIMWPDGLTKLLVYPKATHFLTHSKDHSKRFVADVVEFARTVKSVVETGHAPNTPQQQQQQPSAAAAAVAE